MPAPVGPTIRVWPTSPTCSDRRNGVAPLVLQEQRRSIQVLANASRASPDRPTMDTCEPRLRVWTIG